MLVLLAAHVVAAVLAPLLVRWWGRRAFLALALVPAATAAWALTRTPAVRGGEVLTERVAWVPSLGMELSLRLDSLAWLLVVVVGGVGALVLAYCTSYFADDEPGLGRFAGVLTAFAGAMLGLVVADDLLVLYLFWELTTVFSFLLVGHVATSRASRASATQALVVTTAGGLAMLVGIVLLGEQAGSYQLSVVLESTSPGAVTTAGVTLLLVGALSKSALVPFHFWLPGAMAAPTPVSAYLHAAAMVKAGVYLVARLAPGFAELPVWQPLVIGIGCATMLLGGWRALRQHDLKLLLAYGTVSQLGFLVVLVGTGSRDATLAGLTVLLAHALFKSCLFLVVGTIDHATGTRDLRVLRGLGRTAPLLAAAAVAGGASMAGVPPLLGFVGKEAGYHALWHAATDEAASGRGGPTGPVAGLVLLALVVGSVLTVAYTARFLLGAFTDAWSGTGPGGGSAREPTEVHHLGGLLVGVPAVLAGLSLLAGPLSALGEPVLGPHLARFPATDDPAHLGLWHGLSVPLALSAVTLGVGAVLVLGRRVLEAVQSTVPRVPAADEGYRGVLRALDRASVEVTGAVQRGSLPVSLALILVTVVVLPGGALLMARSWPDRVALWDNPAQGVVAVLTIAAAVLAARSRRRLRAVFLAGVTGYGTAMLFLLHGAPDLALTQVLVETFSLVVFVLVLRRLPNRFTPATTQANRVLRAALGVGVGAAVTGMALLASGVRVFPADTALFAREAYDYGGGLNIVNVTLVDIRAWDTMGELSVVVAAATGVASLVFLRRRDAATSRPSRPSAAVVGGSGGMNRRTFLVGGASLAPQKRSVVFEVVTRVVFHTIALYSVYLLVSGHNNPGGGFAAGMVLGLALAVRYLAAGRTELVEAAPVSPGALLGAGLFLSAGAGLVAMLLGGEVLQSVIVEMRVPLLGDVKFVSTLFFDVGVYLVVVGFVLDVLRSLGGELDAQIERAPEGPSDPAALAPATTSGAGAGAGAGVPEPVGGGARA